MRIPAHFSVAIVGGGASGVIAALHLLSAGVPMAVHLLNRRYGLAGGVAYSFAGENLLLNVPVARMSAWLDRPGDFHDWLEERAPGRYQPADFVPRMLYRDYLGDRLTELAKRAEGSRLLLHDDDVEQIHAADGRFRVEGAGGNLTPCDAVVLALGNCLAKDDGQRGPEWLPDTRYVANPWASDADLAIPEATDDILIIGSGLTAIDTIARLREQGYQRRIHVLSRHGLWPQTHQALVRCETVRLPDFRGLAPRELLRTLRHGARELAGAGGDWRQLIDAIRPETNGIWAAWTLAQQRQFLRHARAYWDVHRHRMSGVIASRIAAEIAHGSVRIHAARLQSITAQSEGLDVVFCARGCTQRRTLRAGLVINCTGASRFCPEQNQPLIPQLVRDGLGRVDGSGLGFAVTAVGELIGAQGRPTENLFALGSLRRGSLWETTAIPEIRVQAAELAKTIVARFHADAAAATLAAGGDFPARLHAAATASRPTS